MKWSIRGFSYVEVLTAIAVLAIAAIPMLTFMQDLLHASYWGIERATAVNLAQGLIEEIRAAKFEDVRSVPRSEIKNIIGYEQMDNYEWEAEVSFIDPETGSHQAFKTSLKKVVVTVYWQGPRAESKVSLETLIANKEG